MDMGGVNGVINPSCKSYAPLREDLNDVGMKPWQLSKLAINSYLNVGTGFSLCPLVFGFKPRSLPCPSLEVNWTNTQTYCLEKRHTNWAKACDKFWKVCVNEARKYNEFQGTVTDLKVLDQILLEISDWKKC